MEWKPITEENKHAFNAIATHPLQSYEWGEFRKTTGVRVLREGLFDHNILQTGFQMTIHPIPHTPWNIGYIPKGPLPTKEMLKELQVIGQKNQCIFIQLEPNSEQATGKTVIEAFQNDNKFRLLPSAHPLFTKYTFQLDITKPEEALLKQMHAKTRYNIRVAQKHGVQVIEDTSSEGFNTYLQLTKETTKRQGFFAHSEIYHKRMWEILGKKKDRQGLTAYLFIANYTPSEQTKPIPLTAWILFAFQNMLYYPYGASSSQYREVMASNLMMWEAIKFGKRLGLKKFDMWGSLGANPNPHDPWYGFHRFKMGYHPELIEFVGSYDFVIQPFAYQLYKMANTVRWAYLRLKR